MISRATTRFVANKKPEADPQTLLTKNRLMIILKQYISYVGSL